MSVKQKKKPNVKFAPIKQVAALSEKNSNPRREDHSPYVYQDKKVGLPFDLKCKIPWTEKQESFLELAKTGNGESNDSQINFVKGPAGCGKSTIAFYSALQLLEQKKVSEIIYIRNLVEVGNKTMGYLPGDENLKLSPFVEIAFERLSELCGPQNAKNLLEKGLVSTKPVNFLRGTQFAGKAILIDEASNMTYQELYTILSRCSHFTKYYVLGDMAQSDIKSSAFEKLYNLFDDEESRKNNIFTFEFDENDIKRSKILKFIVKKTKEL